MSDRGRKCLRRTKFAPTRWVKQLAGRSGQQSDSFYPAPIAPELLAAKATASACPAGSVSPSLGPRIRLVPYRPPWQTQARLRPRRPGSAERASKPLPLTASLQQDYRKPLAEQRRSHARLLLLPCCRLGWRIPPPAWSVRAPWQDDRHTPQCRSSAPVQRSLRACPHTTVAVPPLPPSPPR